MTDREILDLVHLYETTLNKQEKRDLGRQLFKAYRTNHNFVECRKYGWEIINMYEELGDLREKTFLLNEIGTTFAIEGNHDQADELFNIALNIAKSQQYTDLLAASYSSLGTSCLNRDSFHSAIEYYIKALNAYETLSTSDTKAREELSSFMIDIYNNIGLIYTILKRCDDALVWLKKALRISIHPRDRGYSYLTTGVCYYELSDLALALGYFKRALIFLEINADIFYLNICKEEMSKVYLKRKQYELALPLLENAWELFSKYKLPKETLSVIRKIAFIYLEQKNYHLAGQFLHQGLDLVEKINNDQYLGEFYQTYSRFAFETGNSSEAYLYLEKSYELNNKVFNHNLLQNTTFLTAQFDSKQKAKDLEIYRLKNVELVNFQKALEQKNDELVKINEEKNKILGMISHDMKNYIGASISAHELLTLRNPEMKENKYAKQISDSVYKALTLVKDILYLNKMEVSDNQFELVDQDLHEVLEYLIESMSLMAKRKDIDLVAEFYPEPLRCYLNKDRLIRALDNLVINAIKFTPKEGKIIIRTNKRGNLACVHVIDSGIGMSPEIIAQLFNQYSKAGRKGTEGEESTGLGLYIVKTILEKHHATIEVFSEVGKGSDFLIKIPCSDEVS